MQLAIVDDLTADRLSLREQLMVELAERRLSAGISEFESGEAFLEAFSPGAFAAVFLDIYMGGISGMEVAKILYARDPRCKIVFLTTSQEFLLESYAVRATYYLVKPFPPARLHQALEFCFPPETAADTLPIHSREGTVILSRKEILYIESVERLRCIHLPGRTVETADSFGELAALLDGDERFLPCGRGLLIQMAYIAAQEKGDFVLTDGTRLPIPRRARNDILAAFQSFALRAMEVMV